jgi:hypothetical protein
MEARTRASRACQNSVVRLVRIENEPIVVRSVTCNSCVQAAQEEPRDSLEAAISSLACQHVMPQYEVWVQSLPPSSCRID